MSRSKKYPEKWWHFFLFLRNDDFKSMKQHIGKLEALYEVQELARESCDASFFRAHCMSLLPIYFKYLSENKRQAARLKVRTSSRGISKDGDGTE